VSDLHSAYWQARALGASFQLLPVRGLRILGLERLPAALQQELSRLLKEQAEELAWLACLDAGRAIPREELAGLPLLRPVRAGGYIRAVVQEGVHASPEEVLQHLVSIALEFSCPSLERASACWLELRSSSGCRLYLVHVLDCRGLRLALGRILARAAVVLLQGEAL